MVLVVVEEEEEEGVRALTCRPHVRPLETSSTPGAHNAGDVSPKSGCTEGALHDPMLGLETSEHNGKVRGGRRRSDYSTAAQQHGGCRHGQSCCCCCCGQAEVAHAH